MTQTLDRKIRPELIVRLIGVAFFAYLFFGFMLLPCLNTLASIFNTKNAAGERDPFAVIRFFLAGNMSKYVWNSLRLAILLLITVNLFMPIMIPTIYFNDNALIKENKIRIVGCITALKGDGIVPFHSGFHFRT